jgi:hypothetical protein
VRAPDDIVSLGLPGPLAYLGHVGAHSAPKPGAAGAHSLRRSLPWVLTNLTVLCVCALPCSCSARRELAQVSPELSAKQAELLRVSDALGGVTADLVDKQRRAANVAVELANAQVGLVRCEGQHTQPADRLERKSHAS